MSISKDGKRWRVRVYMNGVRKSRNCATKAEALAWESQFRRELADPASGLQTLGDALRRFRKTVTPTRKGEKWETNRLRALEALPLAQKRLSRLTPAHIAEYRDQRLESVTGATVRRELNLIQSVLEYARREWGWIPENPVKDVKKPPTSRPRDRRISEDEIERLMWALGYDGGAPETRDQQVAVLFLLAMETGMRLGEMLAIEEEDIFPRYVRLRDSKNDDKRDVPLSTRARVLIQWAPYSIGRDVASTLFSKAVRRCQIENLRFHDSRHEAVTRLAKKLEVMELARMIGHRDLRSLMVYYNATADELAGKLG